MSLSRRNFILSSAATLLTNDVRSGEIRRPLLSVNIESFAEVSRRFPPLIEWNRHSRMSENDGHTITVGGRDFSGSQIYQAGWYDANYELVNPLPPTASRYRCGLFTRGLGLTYRPSLAGVAMKLTWFGGNGVTGLTFGGDANNRVSVNLTNRYATFVFKASGSAPQGGADTDNSWVDFNLRGGGEPPKQIRVFEAKNETDLLAGNVFDPSWLSFVKQWDVLRLLDVMQINNSPAVDPSDWPNYEFSFWSGARSTNFGLKCGVPLEIIVKLANATGRPVWIMVPHRFTDAAIVRFAEYLRKHCEVPIYVEYSNEIWNTGFEQTQFAQREGAKIKAWSGGSPTTHGLRWAGLRAAQVSSLFRHVYGTDSGNRWTGVICGQLFNPEDFPLRFSGVDHFLNHKGGLFRQGDSYKTLFSHAGVAAYFGPGPGNTKEEPGRTLANWADLYDQAEFNRRLFEVLTNAAGDSIGWFPLHRVRSRWQIKMKQAAAYGWSLVMYEGGNHALCGLPLRDNLNGETLGPKLNSSLAKFAVSQECADLHDELYQLWVSDGGYLPNKYQLLGQHTKYGPWGLFRDLADGNAVATLLSKKYNNK